MIYNIHTINVDPMFQEMCKKPYYGHPHGCPNYGCKQGCPPHQDLFFSVFEKDFYLIFTSFDLTKHTRKLKHKHPAWTERQLYCCLYWQSKARKNLRDELTKFRKLSSKHRITTCPEAMGVNVTSLMIDNTGITLEWPPRKIAYQVAIAGLPKEISR